MRHINVTTASSGLRARVAVRMTVTAVACCLVACGGAGSTGGEPGSSAIATTTTSAALASSGAPRHSPGRVRALRRAGDEARAEKYGYSSFEVCSGGALCASAPTTEYVAEFYSAAGDSGGCTVSSHGACSVINCPDSSSGGQLYSAGTLSISSGIGDVEVTTDRKEGLLYDWTQDGAAFAPGEGLSVSGSGEQVPAFGPQMVVAPAQVDLVAPLPDRRGRYLISTSSPLDLAWSKGSAGGVMDFTAYASFSDSFAYVECDWDVAQGAGAIPAADLATLAGGTDAAITWGEITTAEFAAGPFTVYDEAQIYGAALATFE